MEGMTPTSIVYLLRHAKRTWNPEKMAAIATATSADAGAGDEVVESTVTATSRG